jgi:hypothetical protein
MSRSIEQNSLMNKYDIKDFILERIDCMPRVESKNSECIEEVAGNDLRLLNITRQDMILSKYNKQSKER